MAAAIDGVGIIRCYVYRNGDLSYKPVGKPMIESPALWEGDFVHE